MILVDTSVWIEYLRGTGTRATSYLRERVGIEVATTEPVLLELLAGARSGHQTAVLERLLASQSWCRIEPALDYRAAVELFQVTRSAGHQPRSLQDCLIAAVALRHDVDLAHRDADYHHIAAATGLRVVDLR